MRAVEQHRGAAAGSDRPCVSRRIGAVSEPGRRGPTVPHRRRRRCVRVLRVLVALTGVIIVAVGVVLAATPTVGGAEARVRASASSHGSTDLGGRVPVAFASALIATEDSRFFHHHGIDVVGVARAAAGPFSGGGDQGGSTLDQQLAKQLYTSGRRSVPDKVEQVALAIKLDRTYSKQHILEMYAATVYFGNGYYGLTAAACGYLGATPARLSIAQSALLAGLPQAPSAYDPITHLQLARERQRHVIDRLGAVGALSPARARSVFAAPLHLMTRPHPGTCR